MYPKIIEVAESLGWTVHLNADSVELETRSPAGEDFIFHVEKTQDEENTVRNITQYARNFDPENHVLSVLNLKDAPNLFTLCDDAKNIARMVKALGSTFEQVINDVPAKPAVCTAAQDGLMEYIVSVAIDARMDVPVRAPKGDLDQVRKLACEEVRNMDLGALEFISWFPV
ncbi:MAG: hypothetical protein IKC03_11100, partial [Oscillospiraceae bacterium]|nr:hypothetical protein [Oscillospiraceae bacterium]